MLSQISAKNLDNRFFISNFGDSKWKYSRIDSCSKVLEFIYWQAKELRGKRAQKSGEQNNLLPALRTRTRDNHKKTHRNIHN